MQPVTNSLVNAARKAVKFLRRDFLELEMLQNSHRDNEDFCRKSYSRVKTLLSSDLQKHSSFLFSPEDHFALHDCQAEVVLLINPVDSVLNLSRSLPFFALSITYFKRMGGILTPIYTVVYFPMLDELYYAEKGKGAWLEKNDTNTLNSKNIRLRVSNNSNNNDNAVISCDSHACATAQIKNIRSFGSPCYEITLLLSAKLDGVYFQSLHHILKPAFELMVTEAGGRVINNNDKFIATNGVLAI